MKILKLAVVFSAYILGLNFMLIISGDDYSKPVLSDSLHGLFLIVVLYVNDLLKLKDGD